MATRELLPGITEEGRAPAIRCDSRRVIRRARRVAFARDVAQLIVVAGLDFFFAAVPSTHIPFTDRPRSLAILALFNVGVAAYAVLCRKVPHWNARRMASTWSADERRRFGSR